MEGIKEALELLRNVESLLGTETTTCFMDAFPEYRLDLLKRIRKTLKANGIKPENLSGRWHTNGTK